MYCTRSAQLTAADAVQVGPSYLLYFRADAAQIFGGRGITQSGMGSYIEHVSLIFPYDVYI